MPLNKKETYRLEGNDRRFNSIEGLESVDNWYFKYITLNTNGDEWQEGDEVETDKSKYPPPPGEVIGTIFLDSEPKTVYMRSIISDVVVNTVPPKFVSENVQYLTFNSNRVCKFTINSKVLIDICQLVIKCGDDILYDCERKNDGQTKSSYISDLSYDKTNDTYVLSFTISKKYSIDKLNENQVYIKVWDISGNSAEHMTSSEWFDLKSNPTALKHLIITFEDIEPENKILSKNVEGRVLVKVANPNKSLWPIEPTVNLCDDSIGYLNRETIEYDPERGIMTFYITDIKQWGNIHVEAWIDVENNDVKALVRRLTYDDEYLYGFICQDEGRKYKFDSYIPKYLNDQLYKDFVKFVELFLNTSQESLSTGNQISTLEKVARINDFNDPFKVEPPYLSEYAKQFNIEVKPNLNEYIQYLNASNRPQSDDAGDENG